MYTRFFRGVIFFLFLAKNSFVFLPPAYADPVTITDDLGRSVRLERPAERIVSLAPGLTEILFSLGLENRVVGVTDYCNYPPAALTKTKIGGLNPNIERILILHPDLVVGVAGLFQQENLARFERFHIPYIVVDPVSLDKIFQTVLLLGKATGRSERAAENARRLRDRLERIRRVTRSDSPPRLLYVVDDNPLISVGKGSYLDDLIRDAGGTNITGKLAKPYPLVSMEYVIRENPQVIILATDADRNLTDLQKRRWDRWSGLAAVRDGRIYKVNRDLLNRPGPRVLDGLEELAGLLHPVSTSDSDR
jgi:cobalamin transport system substrate-binding protein